MTRLLRGLRTPAEPRHRAPRPGRHRAGARHAGPSAPPDARRPTRAERRAARRAERHAARRAYSRLVSPARALRAPRRRARYAAAGLLVLSGAVVAPVVGPVAASRDVAVAMHPLATRTDVVPLRRKPAVRRAAPRRTHYRWVSRTVDGPVLTGRATWYGPGFAGRRTASGEVFLPHAALTAAHRTLPFGTRLRVCRAERCVVVRINDRGPFGNAILDLSWLAARRIGLDVAGIAPVTATIVHTKRVRVAA